MNEREQHGATIYNTVLYFSPSGELAGCHRKLMPTGSERTVWGMGDGSTLKVIDTGMARIGGLTCWENYMPLARFHLYAQGVQVWLAPTLAVGDGWIATMRHVARENRMFVVGVNPVLHANQIRDGFPGRDRLFPAGYLAENGPWLEEGNTVIVAPDGNVIAGPVREREETLVADLDLRAVAAARRYLDPVGHYNRPDLFQLHVDTSPRPAVIETGGPGRAKEAGACSAGPARQTQEAQMNTTPVTRPSAAGPAAHDGVLVEPAWLEAHLHDPAVRVVEVDVSRLAYDDWHIDGAVLWNVYEDLKDADYRTAGRGEVARLAARSGIGPDSTVVFYGYAPAMGLWLMKLYGHADVRILDCSRGTWRAEGHPCSSTPARPAGHPLPAPRRGRTAAGGPRGRALGHR